MAIVVYPVDAVTGAPSYTGRLARQTMSPLLAGATAARPLGARSGVRPGTSATTVTATSTTWTMDLHAGILDLETSGLVGPYAYAVNTAQTGAVTAADATRPRIDLVWVRLDDPAESDGSAVPAVVAGYTAGAPLASPVAPATPARCMVLVTIQVPMSGGGSPTVIWVAPYTVAAGAPTPVWSQADRDAKFPTPYDGLEVYRLDLHTKEFYNSAAWHFANWYQPWGLQAYVTLVTNSGASGGTVTVLTTGAFTAVGNRRLKVTASCSSATQVGVGASQIQIWNAGAIQTLTITSAAVAGGPGGYCSIIDTPAAGSITYNLKTYTPATSIQLLAGAANPTLLMVEDIGPNGVAV